MNSFYFWTTLFTLFLAMAVHVIPSTNGQETVAYQTDGNLGRAAPSQNTLNQVSDQTMAIYPNTLDAGWYSGSLLPTMIQYVVVPAVQAHSAAWLNENTRSAVDVTRSWVSTVQQWARRFADFLVRLSEMRFEQCTRKFLCSLGRASARQIRQENRSAGARLIEMLNNIFSLPLLESRMDRVYLEARQLGASGADCESFLGKEQCPVHSSIMETVIHQLRDLF